MRRPSTLKNKRYLAGPYLFWSISFVVIPLLVVFYYAMTNDEGSITFANLAQITTQENLKALGMSLLLSFVSTAICLLLAYPLAMISRHWRSSTLLRRSFLAWFTIFCLLWCCRSTMY